MIINRQCTNCGEIKPIFEFGIYERSKKQYKKYCKVCEPLAAKKKQTDEPRYGDKTKRIKEILRQREIVLENRLNSVNPLSKEFYDIYSELNNIRVKI